MRIDYLSRIISGLLIFISLNVHGNPYQDKDMKDLTVKKINATINIQQKPPNGGYKKQSKLVYANFQ